MKDNDTNFLAPILSAFAALGAIVAALSPLFAQSQVNKIFIDAGFTGYFAFLAFIISVMNLWIFGGRTSGLIFLKTIDLGKLARVRLASFMLFIICGAIFYILKLAFDAEAIGFGWGSMWQVVFYLLTFFFLTSTIGLQFRDTYEQYRWKEDEEKKSLKIRQTLINSGYVEIDLRIEAVENLDYLPDKHPVNYQNAYYIEFTTRSKPFFAVIDNKANNILKIKERGSSENPNK